MKRVLCLTACLVLAALSSPAYPGGPDPQDKVDTVDGLAAPVIKRFPRAEGKVTFAEDKAVRLDIGSADGLKPGMEVFLFRPGQAIRHPVTRKVLGTREEPLGSMVVTSVSEKGAEGELKELFVTRIIPGDTARLSTKASRLLVALVGPDVNPLVLDRLSGALRASNRFEVVGPDEIPKEAAPAAVAAAALIKEKGAEYLLALSTMPAKKAGRTDVSITLYGPDGSTLENPRGTVDATSEVYGEEAMGHKLVGGERRDFFHMDALPYRARHMAVGDITGQGGTEIAVSDGRRIIVYRMGGGVLTELWREAGSDANQHLDVECADLDGDGKDEIYVTNFSGGYMSSYVIAYDGKGYKYAAEDQGVFFRVLDVPGQGRKLLTTTIGANAPYSGVVTEYFWKDGKLTKGARVPLPEKIKDPYGFVLADLAPDKPGKGKEKAKGPFAGLEFIWVDDSDFIQVLDSRGKRLWKSPERYGGYDNFFELDKGRLAADAVDNRGKVKGRLYVRTAPDGAPEIILTKNIALTYAVRRFRGYSGAEIYSLVWNGSALEPRWSIRNIDGYVADMAMGDATNSGREDIAVIDNPTYKLKKAGKTIPLGSASSMLKTFADSSQLLVYKVPMR